ncbi:MAG: hypothetical protein M3R37_05235 [Actinomycetota bacterium]|nr:hypothetical protein [Actinomycetota bacterium]
MHGPSPGRAIVSGEVVAPETEDQLEWLEGLDARFEAAAANTSGPIERCYQLAGRPLRVLFAGETMLRRFAPALEHLRVPDAPDGAHTVSVWDAASTGTEPAPVSVPEESPLGTVFTHSDLTRRALYMVGLRSLSVFDAEANASWYWTGDAARLPGWECASPIRHVLHWWLSSQGLQQVHGGSIGTERGAVLIVGRGGRGKSTTTLSALGSGLKYVGDDYVAVELAPKPIVHSLYNAGKLEPHHLARFPHLRELATLDVSDPLTDFEKPKAIVYVHAHFPAQTVASLPLVGIVIPTIDLSQPTAIVPASRGEALRGLAPSTLLQLHVGDQSLLSGLTELVGQLPAFTLRLGPDVESVGPLIASLVDDQAVDG